MGIVGRRIRILVWKKCNGNCAYCGKPVEFKGPQGFQVDHLDPTYWNWKDEEIEKNNMTRGSDEIVNLMPACRRCNKWKSALTLNKFREAIHNQDQVLIRDVTGYKLLRDYGIITHTPWDGLFYFEKLPGFKKEAPRITATIKQ